MNSKNEWIRQHAIRYERMSSSGQQVFIQFPWDFGKNCFSVLHARVHCGCFCFRNLGNDSGILKSGRLRSSSEVVPVIRNEEDVESVDIFMCVISSLMDRCQCSDLVLGGRS